MPERHDPPTTYAPGQRCSNCGHEYGERCGTCGKTFACAPETTKECERGCGERVELTLVEHCDRLIEFLPDDDPTIPNLERLRDSAAELAKEGLHE